MDFLEILKNSSSLTEKSNKQKDKQKDKHKDKQIDKQIDKHKEKQIDKRQDDKKQKTSGDNIDNSGNIGNGSNFNSIGTYKNIKTGDFIKIIYQKDSILNYYKGYLGEIKEYRKEQDSAVIFLHAISTFRLIKFPITHFIKIN